MSEESVPVWAIAIIATAVCIAIIAVLIHIKKRRNNRLSVYEQANEEIQEKRSLSEESLQTLVTQKHKSPSSPQKQSLDLSVLPSPPLPVLTRSLTKHSAERFPLIKDRQRSLSIAGISHQDSSDKIEVDNTGSFETQVADTYVTIEFNDSIDTAKTRAPSERSLLSETETSVPHSLTKSKTDENLIHGETCSQSASASHLSSSRDHRLSAAASAIDEKYKLKHGALRFHSVRGLKSNEHLTITSGSMRRLVRESILADEEKGLHLPSAAAIVSNSSTSKRPLTDVNFLDITSWWDSPKVRADSDIIATINSVNNLPLNASKSGEDSTSIAQSPPQFRASLSNSASNSILTKSSTPDRVNVLSSHNSTRKSGATGTLGKNTLKNITSNTSSSLQSLFDSSKAAIDDSQKMEIYKSSTEDIQEAFKMQRSSVQMTDRASKSYNLHSFKEAAEPSVKYVLTDKESEEISLSPQKGLSVGDKYNEMDDIRLMLQHTWDSKVMQGKFSEFEDGSHSIQQAGSGSNVMSSLMSRYPYSEKQDEAHSLEKRETGTSSSSHANTTIFDNLIPTHSFNNTKEFAKPQREHEPFRFSSHSSAILNDSSIYFPSPQQSSFESVRYQSEKSSSNNSTATALRLSCGMSSQTWNGRTNKSTPRPSAMQIEQQFKSEHRSERAYYSTMEKGRKVKGSIPWSITIHDKTPAQIERDNYLGGQHSEV